LIGLDSQFLKTEDKMTQEIPKTFEDVLDMWGSGVGFIKAMSKANTEGKYYPQLITNWRSNGIPSSEFFNVVNAAEDSGFGGVITHALLNRLYKEARK